ncbi:hypothetical protein BGZ95_007725 [Linnemannia exigua]|uniref:AMP-activated protein kinase glycogen-binding domain-containing protein n=1 Tax=Linnemannia exigua TaxID=604196 RepID=A0AAD4H7Q2_9FUNG|nr:hypothetical protein BGZ95_007725 [Linnemannia exigua]
MAFRKPAPQYDPRPGKDTTADSKDINSNSLAFLTHSMPTRHRSGSTTSTRSNRSAKDEHKASSTATPLNPTNSALLPPLLPHHSSDTNSAPSKQQSHHHRSHIRLPSLFRRRKHSSATTASLESTSSLSSTAASSTLQLSLQQHTIVMVPQHDIHITWPHPVPSGNAFIAGTWSVPGHGPWEKLPMTRIPGSDSFEIHLDVQEIEDISDYLDEDGYLHHELLDHHHAHDHTHQDSPPLTPTSTASSSPLSRRKRISRFFGRARSSSSASATSTTTSTTASKDLHIDLPYHHQSKDGTILPLAREYRYQYKFVIDDDWKCDHDQHQVQDPHGHWNHELVVELVEQTPDTTGGRSRSSSLQSQHGPQLSEHSPLNKALPTLTAHPSIITTTSDSTMTTSTATTSTTSIDTPTSIIISPAEEDDKKEIEVILQETNENVAVLTPVPASSSVTVSAPAAPIPTSTTTRRGNLKSRDTFEAVLIFDETDDLSDGEGRSKHQAQVESDDEYDDDEEEEAVKEETNNINNAIVDTFDNNNNNENVLLGDEDVVKVDVTPQQDDHASLSPADQDLEKPSVIKVAAADAAADAIPASASLVEAIVSSDNDHADETAQEVNSIEVVALAVEEKKEEVLEEEKESSIAAIEDVFVNSSSVAKSLPPLDEPSFVIPAESIAVESRVEEEEVVVEKEEQQQEETVAIAPIVVEEAKVEPEAEVEMVTVEPEAEVEKVTVESAIEVESPAAPSPAPASVAIPASPVFSFSSSVNSHLLSPDVESESFVLQAAVNLEEVLPKDDDDVSEVDVVESSTQETNPAATTKAALEVVTDAAAIATTTSIAAAIATATSIATAAAAVTVSVNTTATDYPQVPSPPLTPSTMTSSKRDLITREITTLETEIESEKQQQQEETFERSVYMTPRAETSFTKHTTLEETTTTTSTTTTNVEDENTTIDILEDKDLPTSILSGSSSTSSLTTLTENRRSSNSSISAKHNSSSRKISSSLEEGKSREVREHDHDKKKGLPEQYPNLFWSMCKTTAVVSAAVVILGLGIGRKRD